MKLIYLGLISLIFLSCSSKVNEGTDELAPAIEEQKGCVGAECAVCDLPWGGVLAPGQTIDSAYSQEIAKCDQDCSQLKVQVTCEKGQLKAINSTTKQSLTVPDRFFQKCYKQRCDCTHAGTVLEDGAEKAYFKVDSASCATKCESRNLRCRSGAIEDVLTPSNKSLPLVYTKTSCTQLPCSECTTPWGAKVAHLATVVGFKASEVPCGSVCTSQQVTLTCNNGSLSGADLAVYKFGSCTPSLCADCTLGSGDKIAHGSTLKGYKNTVSDCSTNCAAESMSLTCRNGVVSGGDPAVYKHSSCSPSVCKECVLPCGIKVVSGGFGNCFKDVKPTSCGLTCASIRTKLLCVDGVIKDEMKANIADTLLATMKSTYCSDQAGCSSCVMSNGKSVLDGKKVTFFKKATVGCSEQCFSAANAATLTCSNGSFANQMMYPDFKNLTCTSNCNTEGTGVGRIEGDGGGAPNQLCQLPWRSGSVTHATKVAAFSRMAVPKGSKCSAYKAVIECNGYKGLWTGGATYIYPSCIEEK